MSLTAVVVGLGQIGMGYDLHLDQRTNVLTHARAFAAHPAFSLVGAADPDPKRRQDFERAYGQQTFADPSLAVKILKPDVLAIAVPTQHHLDVLTAALAVHRPRFVLCEKPLAYNLEDARQILSVCEKAGSRLFVNYLRRSDPGVQEVRRRFDLGHIAQPLKGVSWYSKGLIHNGSHFLDLLQYWLGDIREFKVTNPGRVFGDDDVEPDVLVEFEGGSVHCIAAKEEHFSHYTVELVAPNGRLRYEQAGETILWQPVISSEKLQGYSVLDASEERIVSDLGRVQWHVVDQIALTISGARTSLCEGREAFRLIEHLTAIRDSV
jgi:predicted dehydrogenase